MKTKTKITVYQAKQITSNDAIRRNTMIHHCTDAYPNNSIQHKVLVTVTANKRLSFGYPKIEAKNSEQIIV